MKNTFFTLFFFILSILASSCSMNRNMDENMSKLDKFYGACDNPHRNLSKTQYKICKDKERAGSGAPLDADTIAEMVIKSLPANISGGGSVVTNNTNNQIWQASIQTLSEYPIKIADFNGGFIETEWIIDKDKMQRCIIKVQINSSELVSNGVNTKFLCQNKNNDEWVDDNLEYTEESKQLTLSILKKAVSLQ